MSVQIEIRMTFDLILKPGPKFYSFYHSINKL